VDNLHTLVQYVSVSTPHVIYDTWLTLVCSKFFVFICVLNLVGVVLAASGHWPYAVRYTGALILGNFHISVLVRNEIFGRFLYLFVNSCFAKVSRLTIAMKS
jgi:hypothetical protein